jgi:hypothetical protein
MTIKITTIALLLSIICLAIATQDLNLHHDTANKEIPVYNYSYRINFDESFTENRTVYRVNGQFIYDPANNRERVDRTNGRYDLFCGSVLPNQTTPCQQIVVNNQRWMVFPSKSTCCFCCDSSHGCGILRPDWLNGGEYLGEDKVIDTIYDKWSKKGTNRFR